MRRPVAEAAIIGATLVESSHPRPSSHIDAPQDDAPQDRVKEKAPDDLPDDPPNVLKVLLSNKC